MQNQNNTNFFPKAIITDVDGTITDKSRRINLDAVSAIRTLFDNDIPVVIASGNTLCSLTFLCKMLGTDGTVICENGGVYRIKYDGKIVIPGDKDVCNEAFHRVESYYAEKGVELELYSPEYRFADVAFARNVNPDEVREIVSDMPVIILDSGFAVHIQSENSGKGNAFGYVADEMGLNVSDFVAFGDSHNDVDMLKKAGVGVAVAGGDRNAGQAADWVSNEKYGDGFVEGVKRYFPSLF